MTQVMVSGLRDLPSDLLQHVLQLLDGSDRFVLVCSCSAIASQQAVLLEASNHVIRGHLGLFNSVVGVITNVLQKVTGRGWFRTLAMQHNDDDNGIRRLCIQLHTFSSELMDNWQLYALAAKGAAEGVGSGDGRVTVVLWEHFGQCIEISQAVGGATTITAKQLVKHCSGLVHWAQLWSVHLDQRLSVGNCGKSGWSGLIEICPSCGVNSKILCVLKVCTSFLMQPLYVGGWYEMRWARSAWLGLDWVPRQSDGVFVLTAPGDICLDFVSCTESVDLRSSVVADDGCLPEFELRALNSKSDVCLWW